MSIFSLFKPKPKPQASAVLEINNSFSSFTGSAFNSPVFRAAVDTVARHCAKLTAHSDDAGLEKLLTVSPNEYMSGYDFLYRLSAAYFTNNNSFAMIERDGGHISALYPLNPSSTEYQQGAGGALFVLMRFADGREVLFPYSDIIHCRRHYFNHELSGADNGPLYSLLKVADTLQQGIGASVKNGTSIKGVLQFTSLVNPQQLKAEKDAFVRDYFSIGNSGGVAATDQRFTFQPTNIPPYTVPADTINAVDNAIFRYIGVSPKIVSGEYSEDDFSAFYESLVEPLALQMSLEFSRKTLDGWLFVGPGVAAPGRDGSDATGVYGSLAGRIFNAPLGNAQGAAEKLEFVDSAFTGVGVSVPASGELSPDGEGVFSITFNASFYPQFSGGSQANFTVFLALDGYPWSEIPGSKMTLTAASGRYVQATISVIAQVVDERIEFFPERLCFELRLTVEERRPKLRDVVAVIASQKADIPVKFSVFAFHAEK